MTEQQQDKSTQPDPKYITAKDYYDYMMDGDGFDFFSAAKKQYATESNKTQKKQEPEWESKPIEIPTQVVTTTTQVKTKYKLQTGVGFNAQDVAEFSILGKDFYYGWLDRIFILFFFFAGFFLFFLWIFVVITLLTSKKDIAQYGIILKSGEKGIINIKGKRKIQEFELAMKQAKYV